MLNWNHSFISLVNVVFASVRNWVEILWSDAGKIRVEKPSTQLQSLTSLFFVGKNDLNLVVSKVAWSSAKAGLEEISNEFTAVRVTNHTTCSCGCKVKPTDCDNRTQQYSKEHCSCQCKLRAILCSPNFRWDPLKCQCRCDPTNIESKCTKRFQFDKETCKCTCSKRPCKQREKVRDRRTCMCKCPSIRCPSGMTLERRTCTCLGNRN